MKKLINGQMVEVEEVEPLTIHEPWSEYQMPNGDMMKVKYVATAIYKIVDDKPGESTYNADFQAIVRVTKAR
jgi:hypothetical protein